MDINRLTCKAMAVCSRRGFPIDDPEYGSAVNWGVFMALTNPPPARISMDTHAVMHAIKSCVTTYRAWKRKRMEELPEEMPARPELGAPVAIIDAHGWLVCVPYSLDELHRMAWDFGLGRDCFRADHYHVPRSQMGRVKAHCYEVPARVTYLVAKQELFV